MGGMIPAGPAGESVRARLLVTDPGSVLSMAAKADGDKTTWLARLLWLVDGSAGPELSSAEAPDGAHRLPNVNARFEHAVRLIVAIPRSMRHMIPVVILRAPLLLARWILRRRRHRTREAPRP